MEITPPEHTPRAYRVYDYAFRAIRFARLDRCFYGIRGARGIILALHRVRPHRQRPFEPNRSLEITPDFLSSAIEHMQSRGLTFVSMDEALSRIMTHDRTHFAALTFDDGYRDTLEYALPILEKYGVPATVFVTTGFAHRDVTPWWLLIEEALQATQALSVLDASGTIGFATLSALQKQMAFDHLRARFMNSDPEITRSTLQSIVTQTEINPQHICSDACMDWKEIATLARHPLVTIGAHTVSHPVLTRCASAQVVRELARSRAEIENQINKPVRHLAYPNGDPASAGPREFNLAQAMGFASAATTRPGLIYDVHAQWKTALPRVSLNGFFQNIERLDTMLSGVPFLLKNLGARLDIS